MELSAVMSSIRAFNYVQRREHLTLRPISNMTRYVLGEIGFVNKLND